MIEHINIVLIQAMVWPQLRSNNNHDQPPSMRRRRKNVFLLVIGLILGMMFFNRRLENTELGVQLTEEVHKKYSEVVASSSSANNSNKKKVSYVTSFWAKKKGELTKIDSHMREIQAALLANIYNPYIDQVAVFFDGVDKNDAETCADFLTEMQVLSNEFGGEIYTITKNNMHRGDIANKVTCIDVMTGQPTYYQMFLNALSDKVTGEIIIMANADMAFDESISIAQTLKEDVMIVLGNNGFSDEMPVTTRAFYDTLVGTRYKQLLPDGLRRKAGWDRNQCRVNPWSWDTWIFHRRGITALEEQHFQRPTKWKDEMALFYMNENGAENAALWAVEQSSNFTKVHNACEVIHSWSFHLTGRTHHNQGVAKWPGQYGEDNNNFMKVFVPKPWGGSSTRPNYNGVNGVKSPPYPPKCYSSHVHSSCFFEA